MTAIENKDNTMVANEIERAETYLDMGEMKLEDNASAEPYWSPAEEKKIKFKCVL